MLRNLLSGFDLREYDASVQRFYLFAIPLFSGMALFSLLYNLYLLRLGYQENFIGQLAGLFPLASGLFAIPTGIISDRIGRKPFLFATALILGFSQLGLCLITHAPILLILSFLGGISGAFLFVNFIPFLAENASSARRSQAIAIWMSIQVVTRMLVSLVGGALPGLMAYLTGSSAELPEPFRYALLIGAALSLFSIAPLFNLRARAPSSEPSTESDSEDTPAETAIPWKHLLTFGSISACRGLSMGLSVPFFNVFFQEELHVSTAVIGTIFFVSMGVGLPSTVAAPALERRFGPTLTVVPLRLLGAAAIALLGLATDFYSAVLLFLISNVMEAITVPTEMAFATNSLPRPYWARMQSLRVAGFQILSGLGSFWAGALILDYGYTLPFGLAGAARVVSAGLFIAVFGYRRAGSS